VIDRVDTLRARVCSWPPTRGTTPSGSWLSPRVRVGCRCEVLELLAHVPPEWARTTAEVKLVFAGIVAHVRQEHGS
jgi:hypothetical protein